MSGWIVDTTARPDAPLYTRGNIGEVAPGPRVPLSWSLVVEAGLEPGWRQAWIEFGAFRDEEFRAGELDMLGCFNGYGYINLSLSQRFASRMPGTDAESIQRTFLGRGNEAPDHADDSVTDEQTEKMLATVAWCRTATSFPDIEADDQELGALRASRPDLATAPDDILLARIRDIEERFLIRLTRAHVRYTFASSLTLGALTLVCESVGVDTSGTGLIDALGGVVSAEPALDLWALSRMVRQTRSLTGEFERGVDGLLERISDRPDATEFLLGFRQFLTEHGARGGPDEGELLEPSWETNPEAALQSIDRLRLAADDDDPVARHRDRAANREQLSMEIRRGITDPTIREEFDQALGAAHRFLVARERTKRNGVRAAHEVRMVVRELAARLVRAGYLRHADDLGMATSSELNRILAGDPQLGRELQERAVTFTQLALLEPPLLLDTSKSDALQWTARVEAGHERLTTQTLQPGDQLEGISGSSGLASGRARIVRKPTDPGDFRPGDVLVAPVTDPGWTPLFVAAAAVVVEVGAQVSHAVIVSRELGVPCVVSVKDATRRIPDGARVTVDGTNGLVTIDSLSSDT